MNSRPDDREYPRPGRVQYPAGMTRGGPTARISRHLFRQILAFAALLLCAVLALAWWGLIRALDTQAWARADGSARRLAAELDRETYGVDRLGHVLRDWWTLGVYSLDAPERLETVVLPALQAQASVSSVNFCRADGTSVLLLRGPAGWDARWLVPGPGGSRMRWTRHASGGGRTAVEPWRRTDYDPRSRDWYRIVEGGTASRWSPEAYRFMTTRDPGITLSVPVRDGDRLLGVIGLDLMLDDLTARAWLAQATPGTLVMVADERGRALVLPHLPAYGTRELRFRDFLRPVGPDLLPELAALLSDLGTLPEGGRRAITEAGNREYYGLARPYRGPAGLAWVLAVAIPEDEIMAGSRRAGLAVLSFAVLGFAVIAWRARAISRRFGRPLDRLARATSGEPAGPEGPGPREPAAEASVWEPKAVQEALRLADRAVEVQVALREQLLNSQRREIVGTLAGGVAHDVNNQLTVILGELEQCIETLGPEHPLAPELAVARDAARRCGENTRALLSLARPPAGSAKGPVDLNRLLREVATLAGRVLGGRIGVALELDPSLPAVEGIAAQLEQVAVNLVVNARDAMPEGGRLTLRTARDGEPGWARLEVADTGVGMTPEVQARIFEPYFTTKAPGQGTGLGLSMAFGIVRSHGGRVEVASRPGAGTTFTVRLPLAAGSAPARAEAAPPAVARLDGLRILVAEDDGIQRAALEQLLRRAGAAVVAAEDGGTAAELWKLRGPFDAVITDLRMPHADGLDLYRTVRAASAGVPVLVVSGTSLEQLGPALERDRRLAALAKPYQGDDVLRALGRLLGRA